MSLKQAEIAYYLKMLLDKTKALSSRVDVLSEEVARKYTDVPPVPYTGQGNSLHFQRSDVVLVEQLDLPNRRFYGSRCIPKERQGINTTDHWEADTTLDKIWVDVPQNISIPEIGDFVEVFFSGMWIKDDVEVPKYALFSPHEEMIGITVSSKFPYPNRQSNPNTYEVAIFNSKFPQTVGKFTPLPMINRGVVVAHNWANQVELSDSWVPEGTFVTVFKSGSYWWFQLRTWNLVYFELYDNKTLTKQPTLAKVLVFNGVAWVDSGIRVNLFDSYYNAPGFFTGKANIDRGWAKLRKKGEGGALDEVELIWMSGPAHIVEFTLTEDRPDTGSEAAVGAYIDHTYLYGHDQMNPETVWFNDTTFPNAKGGAIGTAIWDDRNLRYVVVQCDQDSPLVNATLVEDMCSDTALVSGITPCFGHPFSQTPDIAGAVNLKGHRGVAGAAVTLLWRQTLKEYEVIDVTLRHETLSGPLTVDGISLVQTVYNAAFESCTPSATNIINGTEC